MIVDTILHADRYQHVDHAFAKALEFISKHAKDQDIQNGKYEIIPDIVIAYVVTKNTMSLSETKMEIHKKYMDIHYLLEGSERCGFTKNFEEVAPYDHVQDIVFSDCDDEISFLITEGTFYALWPEEPHRPLVKVGETSESIRKIIVKVLLS